MTDDKILIDPYPEDGCSHKHPDGRNAIVPSDNPDDDPDYHRCEVCGDNDFQAVADEDLGKWRETPSKREMLLALRQRSVTYLEENPDPDPPRTKWRAFWDGFFSLYTLRPPQEPVTATEMMERAVGTMNRAAAQATVQVCDEILEELDE